MRLVDDESPDVDATEPLLLPRAERGVAEMPARRGLEIRHGATDNGGAVGREFPRIPHGEIVSLSGILSYP